MKRFRAKGFDGMRKTFIFLLFSFCAVCLWGAFGCDKNEGKLYELPANFDSYPDTSKVAILAKYLTTDSLARAICRASLRSLDGNMDFPFSIDSLNEAVLKAYLSYPDSSKIIFGNEINAFPETLPSKERVSLYYLAGKKDPYRLGYRMGKSHIADSLPSQKIQEEIEIIEELSGPGSKFFKRFMTGVETARKASASNENE